MDDKRAQPQTEKISEAGIVNFVGEIKSEFSKVSWTTKEELRAYTKIVVGATFVFGLGVYFMDLIIQTSLDTLNFAIRFITG
jgi:preprotein translocase subunit SecE